eukprot:3621508-Pleurochrysis_carterae.AAC.2
MLEPGCASGMASVRSALADHDAHRMACDGGWMWQKSKSGLLMCALGLRGDEKCERAPSAVAHPEPSAIAFGLKH